MGSGQSKDTMHCNEYLNNKGPPPLQQQVKEGLNGMYRSQNSCQPEGEMTWVVLHSDLPGFPDDNTLQITYIFPNGIQTEKHPQPGQSYSGLRLSTYLPDTRDGRKVLKLLEKAFNEKLLFTVATNEAGEGVIIPASIPLKTRQDGGTTVDGYPDSNYLKTVRRCLKDKGIE